MKFTGYVDIKKPRETVVKYFLDPQYLKEYQDGFIRKEIVRGVPGEVGTVSKMYYQQGKRALELTETITTNSLPDHFIAHYHHIHMDNTIRCDFFELDDNATRYEYDFEYTRVAWIMPRLMMMLFPSMFTKQAEKWMRQFKDFVESQS